MDLIETFWAKCISKGMPIKSIIPILKVMILFMKHTNLCLLWCRLGWQYWWLAIHIKLCFLLSNGAIGWSSKKQLYIVMSLTKVEYMATFQKNKASDMTFIIIWNYWSITNDTHCYIWQELKLYILIEERNLSCLHKTYWDSLSLNAKKKYR
jgi:hypothetical protein